MNEIEELIEKFCPEGVIYKTIEEVFVIKKGYTPSKSKPEYWENGTIPWFRMEDIRANGRILSDSIQHITPEAVKGGKLFPANSIIVATTATIGEHALVIVDSLANQQFTFLTKRELLIFPLNMRFFYYYMFIIDEWCKEHVNNGGFASVDMVAFKKLLIPIPPLPVQEAIVEILEKFSSLTAELQTELQTRKSQYEFYRNQLLTFEREDDNHLNTINTQDNSRVSTTICKPRKVKWMRLGDICDIFDGTHQTPNYTNYGVRFVSVENINDLYNSPKYISKEDYERIYVIKPRIDDVFMTRIGSIGKCAVLDREEPLAYYVTLTLIRPNSKVVLSKYIKYIIESSTGIKELRKKTLVNAVPIKINLGDIGTIEIPIPSLTEQQRIVSILDRFDTLINDISTGLPAEIAARRQQYEYYRDKLLTFKRKEA